MLADMLESQIESARGLGRASCDWLGIARGTRVYSLLAFVITIVFIYLLLW